MVLRLGPVWGQADNDLFRHRSLLNGTDQTVAWLGYKASREPEERPPLGAGPGDASLWWSWQAPESGLAVVTAEFAPYLEVPHRLVVVQGDSIGTLSAVVEPTASRIEFQAIEGQTYHVSLILIGGFPLGGTLSLHLPARPVNDRFEERTLLPGAATDVAEARFFGATPEIGGADTFLTNNTIWWSWTAPRTGWLWIEPESGSSNIVIAAYTGNTVEALQGSISRQLIGVPGAGFPVVAGQNYSIGAAALQPTPTVDRLRFNPSVVHLVAEPANPSPIQGGSVALQLQADPGVVLAGSSVLFENGFPVATNPPGQGPWIWTAGLPGMKHLEVLATDTRGQRHWSSPVQITVRPENDDRADAIELVDPWYGSRLVSASYRTWEATPEADDPVPITRSVWYRWRAPGKGRMNLGVTPAPAGLRVLVLAVTPAGILEPVGLWENPAWINRFVVLLNVAGPQEFLLCLDSAAGGAGGLKLEFSAVAEHDAFADRHILETPDVTVTNRLAYATMEPSEPQAVGGASVWYEWTAPADGVMVAQLWQDFGRGKDPWLARNMMVFSGGEFPALNRLTTYRTERGVTVPVTAGEVYWLQIAADNVDRGALLLRAALLFDFALSVVWRPPSEHDTWESRRSLTGERVTFSGTLANAIPAPGAERAGFPPGTAIVWHEWTCPRSGRYVLGVGANPDTARASLLERNSDTEWNEVGMVDRSRVLPFTAEAGDSFVVAVINTQRGDFTGRIEPDEPSPNDDFPGEPLPELLSLRLPFIPWNCSLQSGEPAGLSHTAWWSWRAPTDGWLTIGRERPLAWQLFRGTGLPDLEEVLPTLLPTPDAVSDWVFPCRRGQEYWLRAGITVGDQPDPTRQFSAPIGFTTLGLSLIASSGQLGGEVLHTVQATLPSEAVDGRFPDGLVVTGRLPNGTMRLFTPLPPSATTFTLTNLPSGLNHLWLQGTNHLGEPRWSPGLELSVPPPHDRWAEAESIEDSAWERPVMLTTATRETDEPGTGAGTVWQRWVPALTGQALLTAEGAVLRAYSGDALTTLTPLTDAAPWVSFPVQRSNSYWIQMAGDAVFATVQAWVEPISAQWVAGAGPIFRGIPFLLEVAVTDPNSLVERVDFLVDGVTVASAFAPPYRCELTVSHTNQVSVEAVILDRTGEVRRLGEPMVLKTGEQNDQFADATDLDRSIRGRADYFLTGSTVEPGEPELAQPARRSLWWTWTAPADGRLVLTASKGRFDPVIYTTVGVFIGDSLDQLRLQSAGGYGADLAVTAGTRYRVQVQAGGGNLGWQWLEWLFIPPSLNDDQSAAQELSGSRLILEGNFGSATIEPGEPLLSDWTAGQSLWWRWTAPGAGWLVFHELTRFDQKPVWPYEVLAFRDVDGVPGPLFQNLPLELLPTGTKLWLQMTTPATTVGTLGFEFRWLPLGDADWFAERRRIPSGSSRQSVVFADASLEPDEPRHASLPDPESARSVWFTWTAEASGIVVMGDVTEALEVYRGSSLASLELVAAGPIIQLSVNRGDSFQVAVLSPIGSSDSGRIPIEFWPAPVNDHFEDALLLPDGSDPSVGFELQQAGRDLFEPDHGGLPTYGSVWWRWKAPRSGHVTISPKQQPGFPYALAVYVGDSITLLERVAEQAFDGTGGVLNFAAVAGTEYRLALATTSPYSSDGVGLRIIEPGARAPLRWKAIEQVGDQIRLQYSAPVGSRLRFDQSADLQHWITGEPVEVVAEDGEVILNQEAGQFFRLLLTAD